MDRELDLALEIVKPEVEELAEGREERDFWLWNTTPQDLAKVTPGAQEVS